jgi:hypothetical protein
MDRSSVASKPRFGSKVRLLTYIRPLMRIDHSMPGHDGLFARRLPIAFACFSHVAILGFCRRRFELCAIVQFASQSRVDVLL